MSADQPLLVLGAPGSPYTRKMLALLRYRRIPYALHWGSHRNAPEGLPAPKVALLPTLYFPDGKGGVEAAVDSTPLIRRLEKAHAGRAALPEDPVTAFLNDLIEDYADEWLTKAMFHYRWAHKTDADHAGPQLVFWSDPTLTDEAAKAASDFISQRQIDRLYVVGSNATTAATIEQSYERIVVILDALIARRGYVLGARPASADFALFGQLTQLAIIEPTSAAICEAKAQRLRAWLDRMEDLSGVEPAPADWTPRADLKDSLFPLLNEIGRVYAPFLLANARAAMAGEKDWSGEIDGRAWTQPTFPYQAKCLQWLREGFAALAPSDRDAVHSLLAGTGVERLFEDG